jgi:hypothetical protein
MRRNLDSVVEGSIYELYIQHRVFDCEEVVFSTDAVVNPCSKEDDSKRNEMYLLAEKQVNKCEKWLDEHHPGWRDPTACWDD